MLPQHNCSPFIHTPVNDQAIYLNREHLISVPQQAVLKARHQITFNLRRYTLWFIEKPLICGCILLYFLFQYIVSSELKIIFFLIKCDLFISMVFMYIGVISQITFWGWIFEVHNGFLSWNMKSFMLSISELHLTEINSSNFKLTDRQCLVFVCLAVCLGIMTC